MATAQADMDVKTTTIPLALPATARTWAKSIGTSAKDQQLINGVYEVSSNTQLGSKNLYVTKRAGSTTGTTFASGIVRLKHFNSKVAQLVASSTVLYRESDATSLGTLTGAPLAGTNYLCADAIVGSLGVVVFATSDLAGWYLWSDATSTTFPTFTGDTHTNTVIDNIASTAGIYAGQAISGTGIAAGTRVATVTSATAITTTIATTGTATVVITKDAVAKIIDTDLAFTFGFVQLDGYFFALGTNSVVYQSALNNPASWDPADTLACDFSGDAADTISKIGNLVMVGSTNTIQYFRRVGSTFGSVLSAVPELNALGFSILGSAVPLGREYYVIGFSRSDPVSSPQSYGLYKTKAGEFEKVSDDVTGGIMADLGLSLIGIADTGNKSLIIVHGTDDTTVLAYDPSTNTWPQLAMSAALTSSFGGNFTLSGQSAERVWATGNTWTDSTAAFTMTVQTEPKMLNKGDPFIVIRSRLLADNEASGTTNYDMTADDYTSWVDIGDFDMTAAQKEVYGGIYCESTCAFRLTHSAGTPWRGQALIVDWEPCKV